VLARPSEARDPAKATTETLTGDTVELLPSTASDVSLGRRLVILSPVTAPRIAGVGLADSMIRHASAPQARGISQQP
jgi:hypothetical protein